MNGKNDPRAPDHARAWALFQSNRLQDAKRLYEKICRKSRADDGAWMMLGIVQARLGNFAEAETALKRAVATNPRNFDALTNLGLLCYQQGRYERALRHYRDALALHPNHADALFQAGNAYARSDRLVAAEDYYRRALDANPAHPLVPGNLANVLAYQGRPRDAILLYRRALELQPWSAGMHSNLLLCLHYPRDMVAAQVFGEHRRWAEAHAGNARPHAWNPHGHDAGRKLHIGYVSPDLREHSVAYFLGPLLAGHDRASFEISCYTDLGMADARTRAFAGMVDRVRDVRGLGDEQLAARIREDRVDILVDLAGHTENNRLPLFAWRPAPVQMTYLGYPDTTGLAAVDYRITDRWADPPGMTEHLHTERLLRLDNGFLCFAPPEESPAISPAACEANGFVTFGSFNALTKITPEMLALWSGLLKRLPDAHLLIKNRQLTDADLRERLWSRFGADGIARERVRLLGRTSKAEHMAAYATVDIALDTYPYNGTTTTCDTLWMGVPVVTLAGQTHVSRVGLSLLARIGLDGLAAHSEAEYLDIAADLAADGGRMRALRGDLRDRMRRSTLCDPAAFSREMEALYRTAWAEWCTKCDA